MDTPGIQPSKVATAETEKKKDKRVRSAKWRNGLNSTFVSILAAAVLFIFLAPFAFMVFTSLKTQDKISIVGAPIWPAKPSVFNYNGKDVEVFTVPLAKCEGCDSSDDTTKNLAIVKKGRQESTFVDPENLPRRAGASSSPTRLDTNSTRATWPRARPRRSWR